MPEFLTLLVLRRFLDAVHGCLLRPTNFRLSVPKSHNIHGFVCKRISWHVEFSHVDFPIVPAIIKYENHFFKYVSLRKINTCPKRKFIWHIREKYVCIIKKIFWTIKNTIIVNTFSSVEKWIQVDIFA